MQVFEQSSTLVKEDLPESRSMKIQMQLKKDKILTLLQTFEEQMERHQTKITEKVTQLKTQNEISSESRIETAMKAVSDLERRLFESERDRVILRHEKEQLDRELRLTQQQASTVAQNSELIEMIRSNQQRLEESNDHLQTIIQQLDRERHENEQIWRLQVDEVKGMIGVQSNNII